MRGLDKVLLYMNTIRYLKAVQIRHQILNRLSGSRRKQKLLCQVRELQAPAFTPVNLLIPALDYDNTYLARFCVEDLLKNEIQILHEKHKIDLTKWEVKDASHLWNYNLHYLEFLIPLAAACRNDHTGQYFPKWCEYVNSWMEYPAGDSYEPYTISMRIPNLLICMKYQGRLRRFFRSTPAHNTIMIDEREQAELWGEHRAARRLSQIEHRIGNQSVSGKFRSYRGDCFIRDIRLTEKCVALTDRVIANDGEKHCARQFFHIAPDCRFTEDTGLQVSIWNKEEKQAVIDIPAGSDWLIHRDGDICSLAQDFGELKHKEVLEIRTRFVKRAEVSILIELL